MQKSELTTKSEIISQTKKTQGEDSALQSRIVSYVNKIVRESVLSGLAHFGNRNVVESLLYILELEHSVNMYNLAFELPSFKSGISKMFASGGYILEEHVCDELAARMGLERNGRNLDTLVSILIEETREKSV